MNIEKQLVKQQGAAINVLQKLVDDLGSRIVVAYCPKCGHNTGLISEARINVYIDGINSHRHCLCCGSKLVESGAWEVVED